MSGASPASAGIVTDMIVGSSALFGGASRNDKQEINGSNTLEKPAVSKERLHKPKAITPAMPPTRTKAVEQTPVGLTNHDKTYLVIASQRISGIESVIAELSLPNVKDLPRPCLARAVRQHRS